MSSDFSIGHSQTLLTVVELNESNDYNKKNSSIFTQIDDLSVIISLQLYMLVWVSCNCMYSTCDIVTVNKLFESSLYRYCHHHISCHFFSCYSNDLTV